MSKSMSSQRSGRDSLWGVAPDRWRRKPGQRLFTRNRSIFVNRGGGGYGSGASVPYDFFVAPNGGTGAGSFESPWSLAYAWGSGAGSAQGDGKLPATGARVAIRGGANGVQVKYNVTSIGIEPNGSIGSGVDNPDGKLIWEGYRSSIYALPERACIFGTGTAIIDYCWINGDYNWTLCLESARDWADRNNGANAGANFWIRQTQNGTKIAHCDLHDGGNGVFADANGSDVATNGRVDIYANYIRNQGWNQTGTPGSSAHGLYLHHKSSAAGRMRVEENILGSTFALNCQLYDAGAGGHVEDIDYNGNVHFNAGVLSGAAWPTDQQALVVGGEQALISILLADNFFAWPDGYGDSWIDASWANFNNGVLTILRCYGRGGGSGYGLVNVRGHFATRSNLTIQDSLFRPDGTGNQRLVRISDTNPAGFTFTGNTWVRDPAALAWASNNTGLFSASTAVLKNFANWKTDSGLSAGDTAGASDPAAAAVFVRPTTRFYPGVGNVIIYNWTGLTTIPVDLSPILSVGDRYAIFDNRDPWNPIATGVYGGGTVAFAATQLTDPVPIGGLPAAAAPSFNGKFNAYIVRKTG